MSTKLRNASMIAVAASTFAAILGAAGSGATAQETAQNTLVPVTTVTVSKTVSSPDFTAQAVVQPLPDRPLEVLPQVSEQPVVAEPVNAGSLADLVSLQPQPAELPRELNCLAGAIYFEAKSESLTGQLAVGRVVVARSKSGRFPASYCGVVYQRSQFSFVRGQSMPGINKASRQWKNAVAIAQIADEGTWESPVEGALYFHAAYVSPGWRLRRMARVENHIFYR